MAKDRETNPNGVLIQFTPACLAELDRMAESDAANGEKANRSRLVRDLVWWESTRREQATKRKSKKVSQGS